MWAVAGPRVQIQPPFPRAWGSLALLALFFIVLVLIEVYGLLIVFVAASYGPSGCSSSASWYGSAGVVWCIFLSEMVFELAAKVSFDDGRWAWSLVELLRFFSLVMGIIVYVGSHKVLCMS